MSTKSTAGEDNASTPKLPASKLTAVARFKSFTGSLAPKREKRPPVQFPPPSWNIDDYSTSPAVLTPSFDAGSDKKDIAQDSTTPPEQTSIPPEEDVEPFTFAKRLRSMIELLPVPGMGSSAGTPTAEETTVTPHAEPTKDQASPPVPPDIDPKLVKMLSSEDLMNGDAGARGKESNPGIWNILAGLRKSDKDSANAGDHDSHSVASSVEEQDRGLMMYAPLEPLADSQVSLADAEVVKEPQPSTIDKLKGIVLPGPSVPPEPAAEKRVWVPSTTQISVLTAWWGYRLYLPPPVMAKLGASSVKAAARAAMVTSALKWMLDKIPMAVVPVQFKPAVTMLKTLTPITGYVGVFIAWSWDRIRALDDGNGVVLTATWLLPVALLPMAWDAGTIYRPILMPEPEEILKAEEEARAAEQSKDGKANGEGEEGKDKKKNKSKFRFW